MFRWESRSDVFRGAERNRHNAESWRPRGAASTRSSPISVTKERLLIACHGKKKGWPGWLTQLGPRSTFGIGSPRKRRRMQFLPDSPFHSPTRTVVRFIFQKTTFLCPTTEQPRKACECWWQGIRANKRAAPRHHCDASGNSRTFDRQHSKPAATFDTIGFKIVLVHGKDRRKRFPFRKIHQGSVGEIHRAVPVARHQGV
jgi:hypothetical protein